VVKKYGTYSLKKDCAGLATRYRSTTASTALGGYRIQQRIRSEKYELERHCPEHWDSSRKRLRQQHSTDSSGIAV